MTQSRRGSNVLLLLASVLLTGLVLEAGLRLWSGDPLGPPRTRYAGLPLELHRSAYPASYDAELGYVPTPGARGRANVWGTRVTITPDSVRSNGTTPPLPGHPIIAVGDSFTFGDEVNDAETWPSHLERMLGQPVVNGGVFGYGLDQMVLRAERLLETQTADTLVVALIGDSVARCEFSYRYAWKPYFTVEAGALRLANVPVPSPDTPWGRLGVFEIWLRRSHLADFVGSRLAPEAWLVPEWIRVHRRGIEVSRLLVERLESETRRRDVRLLWVVLWHPGADNRPALAALGEASVDEQRVLIVGPKLREKIPDLGNPARTFGAFFNVHESGAPGHMNATGNREVARLIAQRLLAFRDRGE